MSDRGGYGMQVWYIFYSNCYKKNINWQIQTIWDVVVQDISAKYEKKLPVIIEGCLRYWVVNLKMTKELVCCQVNVFSCLLECICALRRNVFVLSAEMYFAFEGSQWDGRMRAIQRGFPHTLVMMHVSKTIFKLSLYRFTSQSQSHINNGKHCQRHNDRCKVGIFNK